MLQLGKHNRSQVLPSSAAGGYTQATLFLWQSGWNWMDRSKSWSSGAWRVVGVRLWCWCPHSISYKARNKSTGKGWFAASWGRDQVLRQGIRGCQYAGFDVCLRCLEYKPNPFHTLNCLTLPETQNAAQGKSGLGGRDNTTCVCFFAGVLSSWWSVTAPQRWMLWWVPWAVFATLLRMGGRAKGLHEASRAPATQQPCWLPIQPSGSPLPDRRRAAINSMLFSPLLCTII